MIQPASGVVEPETPRPFKRRYQPGVVQGAIKGTFRMMEPYCEEALLAVKRHSRELWRKGKRNPRALGLAGGALAVTLLGAYALSATGTGGSLCPPMSQGKIAPFLVLMDSVPPVSAGEWVEIRYDVCGLPTGTPYTGKIKLSPKTAAKKSAAVKPLVVTFKGKASSPATRREQPVDLRVAKPGIYTLELTVADPQGRARKKVEKLTITPQ